MEIDDQVFFEFQSSLIEADESNIEARLSSLLYDLFKTDSSKYLFLIERIVKNIEKRIGKNSEQDKNLLITIQEFFLSLSEIVSEYHDLKAEEKLIPQLFSSNPEEKGESPAFEEETKDLLLKSKTELESQISAKLKKPSEGFVQVQRSLNSLNEQEILQFFSVLTAPNYIQAILNSLCIMLNHPSECIENKVCIKDFPSVLHEILDYNKDNITKPGIKNVRTMLNNINVSHEKLRTTNHSYFLLYQWLTALIEYQFAYIALEKDIKILEKLKIDYQNAKDIKIKKFEVVNENLRIINRALGPIIERQYCIEQEIKIFSKKIASIEEVQKIFKKTNKLPQENSKI